MLSRADAGWMQVMNKMAMMMKHRVNKALTPVKMVLRAFHGMQLFILD
jgi:hypothetical protein